MSGENSQAEDKLLVKQIAGLKQGGFYHDLLGKIATKAQDEGIFCDNATAENILSVAVRNIGGNYTDFRNQLGHLYEALGSNISYTNFIPGLLSHWNKEDKPVEARFKEIFKEEADEIMSLVTATIEEFQWSHDKSLSVTSWYAAEVSLQIYSDILAQGTNPKDLMDEIKGVIEDPEAYYLLHVLKADREKLLGKKPNTRTNDVDVIAQEFRKMSEAQLSA